MSLFMSQIASQADFIQCDITYDSSKEYPYIFNAVAFDNSSMEWIVVARIRLDAQNSAGYALCFKKLFEKCKSSRSDFELGITLQGLLIDWFDAEIKGLRSAVGKEMADKLLKGCKVHWQHSCQHVAEKVSLSQQREKEKGLFLKIVPKFKYLRVLLA